MQYAVVHLCYSMFSIWNDFETILKQREFDDAAKKKKKI